MALRDDWAAGKIVWRAIGVRFLWIFALVYNVVLVAVALATPFDRIRDARPTAQAALVLLPLVGGVLIAWALRRTLRGRDYGLFTPQLETVPAAPGGQLRGTVEAFCGEPPQDGFDVRLACRRTKVLGSSGSSQAGFSRSRKATLTRPVWQTVYNTPALPSDAHGGAVTIPVHFNVPAGVPETSRDLPSPYSSLATTPDGPVSFSGSLKKMAGLPPPGTEWLIWQLTIHGSLPSDLSTCCFDVPVFEAPAPESRRATRPSFEVNPSSFSTVGRLRFDPLPGGGSQVVFPPRSNIAWALGICLTAAIGSSLLAWASPGAREIAGVIAIAALFFAGLFAAAVMRSVSRIRIGGGDIAVTLGRCPLRRTKRFAVDQVAAIVADGMYGQEQAATFACAIRRRDGTSFRFDTTLEADSDLQTLLREIRDRVGLRSSE